MKQKTTYELLLEKYGERYVHLERVKEYIGIENDIWLNSKAKKGELGFSVFKAIESKRAPYLADLESLADMLDKRSIMARNRNASTN